MALGRHPQVSDRMGIRTLSLVEGARVSYVGDEVNGLQIGDRGKVILRDGAASHIRWMSGEHKGSITLVDDLDLVVASHEMPYEDLESGGLVSVAVAQVMSRYGHEGLYEALSDEGHVSTLEPVVDQAIGLIAAHIRHDPSFREVLSELDPVEGEEFVAFTTYALLRDALREAS